MHSTPTAGHLGVAKTYEQTSRHFYWPKMAKEVKKFVTSCDECQHNKSSNQQPAGLLQPLEIPAERWTQRSEEHTSELQSPCNLVCRLLLEKKTIVLSVDEIIVYQPARGKRHSQGSSIAAMCHRAPQMSWPPRCGLPG